MSDGLTQAAEALLAVLEAENAALCAMDLGAAARLLGRKEAAARALAEVVRDRAGVSSCPRPLAERLRAEAARNRDLLERGIAVQGRVLAIVAAASPAAVPPRYGSSGGTAATGGRGAVAISLRA